MYRRLKDYLESIFMKILIIVYLLWMIVYQLSSSTNAYFSDSDIHHVKLSAIEVFPEENTDNALEKESEYDQISDPTEEGEVGHLREPEEKEFNQNEEQLDGKVDKYLDEHEQTHRNQEQDSDARSEQSMEETEVDVLEENNNLMEEIAD